MTLRRFEPLKSLRRAWQWRSPISRHSAAPLTWPREIPFEGEPANVAAIVGANERWLEGSEVPKLFVNAEPGSILMGRQREIYRRWANQSEVTLPGLHFVQEDSGEEVGVAIASWLDSL
jgi:haloalkane dehalogenase